MILTRADIPIADEELAAQFVGLLPRDALLLAQAELRVRSAQPQNKNLRNLKTLVRQMAHLEEPETKVWLQGLRAQEYAGARLTAEQRTEVVRWLSSLAVLSKYRHGTHARCEPVTRPKYVVGHVGAIEGAV